MKKRITLGALSLGLSGILLALGLTRITGSINHRTATLFPAGILGFVGVLQLLRGMLPLKNKAG